MNGWYLFNAFVSNKFTVGVRVVIEVCCTFEQIINQNSLNQSSLKSRVTRVIK